MKKLIFGVAATFLLAVSPALAQNHDNNHHAAAQAHHASQARAQRQERAHRATAHVRREVKHHQAVVHRENVRRNVRVRRQVHNARVRHVVQHQRAEIRNLRRNIRASRRFHFGIYHRPAGWYSRRWAFGERLPRAWFARNYWITNYVTFGLIAPPGGYVWVREGDDAVLVDTDTGEIIRVVYGIFY